MTTFLLALLLCYILARHLLQLWELRGFPPGYPRLPIIGCALSVGAKNAGDIMTDSTKLEAKYGSVIGYAIGVVR